MRVDRCRAAVMAFLGLLPAMAAVGQTTEPASATGAAKLEISPRELHFGEVWQGQPARQEFTLKNVGDAPLTLDVGSSCGCTVPSKPRSPLEPGGTETMTITYDTVKRIGAANQTVTLRTNDPAQPSFAIRVTGTVKPLYEMEPKDGLVFGELTRSSQETRSLQIINRHADPLMLKLKDGQDFGPFTVELRATEPGQKYLLNVTTRPPLAVNRYQQNIVIETNNALVPQMQALAYGFVQAPVNVRPAKLFLPKQSVAPLKRILRVTYSADYPLEIIGVKASNPAIEVVLDQAEQRAEGTPARTIPISVVLPPGDRLTSDEKPRIEITTSAADEEYKTLVVPIDIIPAQGSAAEPPAGPARPPAPATPAPPGAGAR